MTKRPHNERHIAKAITEARDKLTVLLTMLDDNTGDTPLKKREGREGERTDRVLEAMGALRAAAYLTLA